MNIALAIHSHYSQDMTKKPGLIPNVTTDKNGKITTVYRKPTGVPETNLVIPAPFAPAGASTGRTATINKVSSLMMGILSLSPDRAEKPDAMLERYPDDFIERLDHQLTSDPNGSFFAAKAIERGASLSFVSEMLTFGPIMQTDSSELADELVRGLRRYKQLPDMQDYGTAPKEVIQQCAALITVAELLDDYQYDNPEIQIPVSTYVPDEGYTKHRSSMTINNDDLIEIIMEHPEEAERIVDLIIERGSEDMELIREIMGQDDSRALTPGIL